MKSFTVKVPTVNFVNLVAPVAKKLDDRKSLKAAKNAMEQQMIDEGRLIRFAAALEQARLDEINKKTEEQKTTEVTES